MDSYNSIINKNVIFFDGVCNLCNGAVNFIIDHDKRKIFRFSSLQSDFAKNTLSESETSYSEMKTIIFLDNEGKVYKKSDAVFEIIQRLGGVWSLVATLRFIPRFIRDFVYDFISRNRYSFFGRKDSCRLPTPELQKRFLDAY